jgi:NAD(P)-dependent dehydrogenase (short-subunit alcohol dehydrogenase family)
MLLDGKSVVITGSGSGVGRAAALVFAREGAKVVCADVREDWIDETVKLVADQGGSAVAQVCNVTSEDEVKAAIARAADEFGRLDVMYNNVGVSTPRPGLKFEDHSNEDWDRLMDINVRGTFFGMKYAVLRFKEQGGGGAIVNTGSVAGLVGWGGTIYGASKAGMMHLTKAVAIECAADNIRVNAVCPAAMPGTNFSVPDAAVGSQGMGEMSSAVGQIHPLGRPIEAEDIAEAAAFLASDRAKNITGVFLPVDGGYVAR